MRNESSGLRDVPLPPMPAGVTDLAQWRECFYLQVGMGVMASNEGCCVTIDCIVANAVDDYHCAMRAKRRPPKYLRAGMGVN